MKKAIKKVFSSLSEKLEKILGYGISILGEKVRLLAEGVGRDTCLLLYIIAIHRAPAFYLPIVGMMTSKYRISS